MKFLSLLGKRLKDDEVVDVLEAADMEVVYHFDRSHENQPDKYWATARKKGFQLGFDAAQILEVIFLHAAPDEKFASVDRSDCDILFFSTAAEVETYGAKRKVDVAKGAADFLGIRREWVRLKYEKHSLHYEFRGGSLALVTITKTP